MFADQILGPAELRSQGVEAEGLGGVAVGAEPVRVQQYFMSSSTHVLQEGSVDYTF